MALLDIVLYPDPFLRTKTKPIQEVTDEVRTLVADMVETMYDAPGIGLAAPQIGSDKRVCVIDCSASEEPDKLWVLINPEIVKKEGKITWEEGCLSIPGVFEDVKRAERVVVRAQNIDGEFYEIEAEGLEAVCLQHEIDHLNGVLFFDHLSRLKLRMAHKKYKRTRPQYLTDLAEKRKKQADEAAGIAPRPPKADDEGTPA